MNIFVLGETPLLSAQYHCDKHVVKMILETGQLLATCHWRHLLLELNRSFKDFSRMKDAREFVEDNIHPRRLPIYAPTHPHHPCSLWTGETLGNYRWALDLMRHLLDEYTVRYRKNHAAEVVWRTLIEPPAGINQNSMTTPHRQAIPEDCRVEGDAVSAYRKCYRVHKRHFAKWTARPVPHWFLENV